MTAVLVVGDERKGGTRSAIEAFAEWLRGRVDHVTVVMGRDAPLDSEHCDLVVVLGGDGSMLGAARRMGEAQRPTLGINLGRLGFLTAFGHDQAHEAMEQALAGKLCEERRPMLECVVERADGSASEPVLCLNDGVLVRRAVAGIITVEAQRDGREIATYAGDGVIVATPTGSTAYSLAAGGPIVYPGADALVLTPLASHMLSARSLIVPIEHGLELVVQDAGGVDASAFTIDGQVTLEVRDGDRVSFRRAAAEFRHLATGPHSFYEILREKFGWAITPRERVRELGGGAAGDPA